MNVSALDTINNLVSTKRGEQSPEALRQAAVQFEGLLLLQLTSALNQTDDEGDGEDKLFGGDGGTGLAKQMFSEQLATSMAESGGVGLADLITSKLSGNAAKSTLDKTPKFGNALAAIKDIRKKVGSELQSAPAEKLIKTTAASKYSTSTPIVSNTRESSPSNEYSDGIEIVSTAAEDIAKYGDADLPKPVMGDPDLFKYYRPRIVPSYALNPDSARSVENVSPVVNKPALSNVSATTVVNYQMPVRGRISSEFGNRFHPIDKHVKFHAGVDIAAAQGTPIATAASGTITFAGWSNGYGNLVVVQHPDGRETRYGHTSKMFVSVGETVTAGQQIAAVGSTGKSTGPHLHFEMRENGHPVNPLEFLP